MLNNKGFTVIELIMSFVFTSILAVSLFSVVVSYRNKQTDLAIQADLLAFKSQLTIDVQKDIQLKGLYSIDYCMAENQVTHELERVARCIILNFNDSTSKEFKVKEEIVTDELTHPDGNSDKFVYGVPYIVYGGIRYNVPDGANVFIRNNYILEETSLNDGIETNTPLYNIRVELAHNDLDADIDISIVCSGSKNVNEGAAPYASYNVGDTVYVQLNNTTQKKFVVIKNSSGYDAYLTLLYDDLFDGLAMSNVLYSNTPQGGGLYENSNMIGLLSDIKNIWTNAKVVRLITIEEISYILSSCPYYRNVVSVGETPSTISLSSAPAWLKSSNYWTSSMREYSKDHPNYQMNVWVVTSSKVQDVGATNSNNLRPVIEVSKIYVANNS